MQQFARVLTDSGVVPSSSRAVSIWIFVRSCPTSRQDVIAGSALTKVNTAGARPAPRRFHLCATNCRCSADRATGFNYKKHIEEFKMKPPTEPEVFLKAITS